MRLSRYCRPQLSPIWSLPWKHQSRRGWKSKTNSVEFPSRLAFSSSSPTDLIDRLKAIANGGTTQSVDAVAVTETLNGISGDEQPKKKKKKKKKKGTVTELGSVISGWSGENWKEEWGEDKLRASSSKTRSPPPHISLPISYSRRIEGLLEDVPKPVLQDLSPPTKQSPIATLHHGLERVLFNPGVHWLRDPRSRVYNFPPALGIIPKVVDFAFERLTGFIRSSRDEDLWTLAKQEKRKFGGSTSSLSGMLCHIYFLLSGNKTVDTNNLSLDFRRESKTFTPGQRMAASVVFNHKDGVYSIDSSSSEEDREKNILLWMGTLLEKYITMPSGEFLSYLRSHPVQQEQAFEEPVREAYRYSKSEKYILRSQLDCHDSRLPGTGVFDIKTRACLPIRMDILNFEESSGYVIRSNTGLMGSFEREYFDLIRSAFLKYQFQARIGNMDGVFVAYHNTARMFGFQYIPLEEMDQRLFGPAAGAGDRVFQKCMETLELISEEIISCFPGQSVNCTFETQDGLGKDLNIWVEPLDRKPSSEDGVQHTGETKEQRTPIKQIVVSAKSFCGNTPAKGARCVETMDQPWTVHWAITHRSSDSGKEEQIRADLQAAKDRRFRAYSLPTGVSPQDIEKWWDSLDFSGSKRLNVPLTPLDDEGNEGIEVDLSGLMTKKPRPQSFFTENFIMPDSRIQNLRDLANEGREETIRIGLEDRGKPKVVLGVGEVDWEDALAEEEIASQIRKQATAAESLEIKTDDSKPDNAKQGDAKPDEDWPQNAHRLV
ncbi:mitochondrial protein Pet127-domain-containing protein [Lentinula raphanica]|nr:mitochondrial protein Pet127-domain-containing protein [Lentinula raphanica]